MTRTIYYTASSLDGYLATQDHSLDWLLSQEYDSTGLMDIPGFLTGVGALIMGSSTYEWSRRNLMESSEKWPYDVPAWVMTSRRLPAFDGADLRFASGDVGPVHAELVDAAGDRDIWVLGGGELAGRFADAGLLDEIVVAFAPVTLGSGMPLLTRRLDLRLLELERNKGFAAARYQVVPGPLAA